MARRAGTRLLVRTVRRGRASLLRSTALQAATLAVFATQAHAQAPNAHPTGGQVVAGTASIGQTSSTTTINQSTQRAAINWQSFNVGSQQSVQFNQPNASAVTLNRVNGPDPSAIAGRISANGGIIITNPSGVMFSRGSQVNAASLIVSAPGITNQNFMAGRLVFDQTPNPNAQVSNAGTITIKQAGLAALVAPSVANSGTIIARMGHVVLAGAEAHTIDLYGDGLMSIDVTKQVEQVPIGPDGKPVTALVTNTGTVIANGGTVQISARAADGIIQNLVDAGGRIQANTAGGHTGRIEIEGVGGSLEISGRVAANGGPGQAGGRIAINASGTVALGATARVTANGHTHGGIIALGTTIARARAGRAAALNPAATSPGIPAGTASQVTVASGAIVAANGRGTGNGGTITALSTQQTTIAGQLQARGGQTAGSGGVVEASSQGVLNLVTFPDTAAPHGTPGTIYLDPYNLIIGTGTPAATFNPGSYPQTGQNDPPTTGTSYISPAQIEAASASGNSSTIRIEALNDLTVQEPLNLSNGASSVGSSLSLYAGHDLSILASIDLGYYYGGGAPAASSLTLQAVHQLIIGPTVTGGAPVSLTGFGDFTFLATSPPTSQTDSSISVEAGTVMNTQGAILFKAANEIDFGPNVQITAGPNPSQTTDLTGIDVYGGLDITAVQGATLTVNAGATAASPHLSLYAGRDIALYPSGVQLNGAGTLTIAAGSSIPGAGASVPGAGASILGAGASVPGGGITTAPAPVASGSVTVGGSASLTGGNISITSGAQGAIEFDAGSSVTGSGFGTTVLVASGSGGTSIGGALNSAAGTTELDSGGPVIEPATGALTATDLNGYALSYALLGQANHIQAIGANYAETLGATGGNVQIVDQAALTIGSSNGSVGGGIAVPAAGTIDLQTDSLTLKPGIVHPLPNNPSSLPFSLAAPSGTVAIEPYTSGTPVELLQGPGTPGALSIRYATLNDVDTDTLRLGSSTAGTLTLGPASANLDLTTVGAGISELDLLSGATISQPAGNSVIVPTLTANGASVSLQGSNNQVTVLGGSGATTGTFSLNDKASLTLTGPVTVPSGQTITLTADQLTYGPAAMVNSGSTGAVTLQPHSPGSMISLGALLPSGTTPVPITTGMLTVGSLATASITIASAFNLSDVGTLNLIAAGPILGAGGGITVPRLTGHSGSATLTGTNFIDTLGPFTTSTGFALTDAQPLTVTGPVSDGASIALNVAGGLTLLGNLTAPSVSLAATGAISQPAGLIDATTLSGSASTASFGQASNTVTNIGTFTTSGNFALTDSVTLNVTGPVSVGTGETLSLIDNNVQIQPGGSLAAPGGTVVMAPLTPGTAFTLGSFVPVGGITANTLQVGSLATGDITITGTFYLPSINELDLISGASITEAPNATLHVGVLTGQAASASFNGPNEVGNLGQFTTLTGFSLANGQSLTVTGPIQDNTSIALSVNGNLQLQGNLDAPSISLIATGGISQLSGSIIAGSLTGSAGVAANLPTSTNQIAELGPFTAATSFALTDATNLAVAGTIDPPDVTLNVAGDLAITAPIDGDLVTLNATGAISQSGLGTIAASTLTGSAASATLPLLNDVATLASFATGTGFVLNNAEDLTVAGPVTDKIGISLSTQGTLLLQGNLTAPTIALTAITNQLALLGGGGGAATLPGDITQTAGLLSASRQLTLTAADAIDQTGGSIATTILTGSSGSTTTLGQSNAVTTLGSFTSVGGFVLNNTQGLAISGPVTDNTSISLATTGPLTLAGMLNAPLVTLTATAGAITQPAGSITATTLSGNAASVALNQGNAITNLGSFVSTGDFALSDAVALNVTGAVSAGMGDTLALASDTIQIQLGGSLAASNGTVALAPLTPGTPLTISSSTPTSNITASTLQFGSPTTGNITINGTFDLATINTLDLVSGAAITESAGASLTVATLTGQATSATLDGPNQIGTLGPFSTTAGFALTNAQDLNVTGALTGNGPIQINASGYTLTLNGMVSAPTLTLNALTILQPAGTIQTGELNGAATTASLSGNIATLGTFTGTGPASSLQLSDTSALLFDGAVTGYGTVSLSSSASILLSGNFNASSLTFNVPNGSISAGDTLTVGTLSGTAGQGVQFSGSGADRVGTLGNVNASTINLVDAQDLTVAGTLVAGTVNLSATASLTLQTGSIISGNVSLGVTPGSGGGAQLVQAGETIIAPAAVGGTGMLSLSLPSTNGTLSLNSLVAPSLDVTLNLGSGTATGTLIAGALQVNGSGGAASLAGQVAGQTGGQAATISTISPAISAAYQLNGCTIATSCTVQVVPPPPSTPTTTPPEKLLYISSLAPKAFYESTLGDIFVPNFFVTDLITIGVARDPNDPDLILPNISDRDY